MAKAGAEVQGQAGTGESPRGHSSAVEDYLEVIYRLIHEKGYARAAAISERLSVTRASVTNMIQRLGAEGLVNYEKYRGMVLTDEGESIAKSIVRRHSALTEFLEMFELDPDVIFGDVEGMEHHVSRPTLDLIRHLTAELKRRPALVRRVRERMASAEDS